MKKQHVILVVIGVVVLSAGLLIFMSEKSHAPKIENIETAPSSSSKLDAIRVTYNINQELQQLYGIEVSAAAVKGGSSNNLVHVSGKACNSMQGSFVIIDAGARADGQVIKILKDGRRVVDASIVSTMMACIDQSPQTDDNALSEQLKAIGLSIESYQ